MIPEFEALNNEELDLMHKVPLLVSILIAGADDNIDRNEMKEAITIVKGKKTRSRKELQAYYREVADDFEDKLKVMIHDFPNNTSERNKMISKELEGLNEILPKLEKPFAIKFYESIKDLARKIAEASGGILGYMSVGYEESKLIDLKMIRKPS